MKEGASRPKVSARGGKARQHRLLRCPAGLASTEGYRWRNKRTKPAEQTQDIDPEGVKGS